ncbi:MAG: hypothetical protein ACOZF0_09820 [Thermodesulfobacteriota bacterium]
MKFSLLMTILPLIIRLHITLKKYVRDMLKTHHYRFVMMTRDGRRGKRFLFRDGTFATDNVLNEYDVAYVWRDGNTAFKVLTNPDPTGLFKAEANRDLEIRGDKTLSIPLNIFLGYATGNFKKK